MGKRRIKHVTVIGSGIMGSGIACHFANIGCEVSSHCSNIHICKSSTNNVNERIQSWNYWNIIEAILCYLIAIKSIFKVNLCRLATIGSKQLYQMERSFLLTSHWKGDKMNKWAAYEIIFLLVILFLSRFRESATGICPVVFRKWSGNWFFIRHRGKC